VDEAPRFGGDAGDTVGMWFSTPARTPSSLCVGAVTVDGRLHLTLRYPYRLFGPAAARSFGECLAEQLRLMAEHRRKAAPGRLPRPAWLNRPSVPSAFRP
jgi:hypothetical protein